MMIAPSQSSMRAVCAPWLAWILAPGDTRAPSEPSRLAHHIQDCVGLALWRQPRSAQAFAPSCDQLLVGQPLPGDAFDETGEPVERMALDVAEVKYIIPKFTVWRQGRPRAADSLRLWRLLHNTWRNCSAVTWSISCHFGCAAGIATIPENRSVLSTYLCHRMAAAMRAIAARRSGDSLSPPSASRACAGVSLTGAPANEQ